MTMTKADLIEFLNLRFPDGSTFEISIDMFGSPEDNSLLGTTFGSAQHMIRSSSKKIYSEDIYLSCKYLA